MAQNTNSSAFLRLKPLENTNTGAIVQEHLRYLNKTKSEEEALKVTQKAKADEFKRKRDKQTFENYNGLAGVEAKGYFTEQVVKYKNDNSDRWLKLAKLVEAGDEDAIIEYGKEKEKLNNLINASVTVSDRSRKLLEQKQAGTYNEYLDQELLNFNEQLARSNYTITPDGKYKVFDKDNPDVLLEVDPLNLSGGYLDATYHKSVNFQTVGTTLGKSLLDTIDGNKQITPETRVKGIQLAQNQLNSDPILAKSWYVNSKKQGYTENEKSFEELTNAERIDSAGLFYDKTMLPSISETTKTVDTETEALKKQAIRSRIASSERANRNKTNKPVSQLRSIADGILAGDKNSINSLLNQKLEEQGSEGKDIFIRDIDYKNGVITIKKSNDEIVKINSGEEGALGLVLKLIRPNDKVDEVLGEYNQGKETNFTKNEATGLSKFEFNDSIKNAVISDSDGKTVANLKKLGIKVEAVGKLNDVVKYNGKEYKIENKAGADRLIEAIMNNEKSGATKEKEEPKKLTYPEWKKENPNGTFKEYQKS